jgi:hypothetical protein
MTTDSTRTPPSEPEKPTTVDVENVSKLPPTSAIEAERAQLLANLPDPDAGTSEEERREIVSCSTYVHLDGCH